MRVLANRKIKALLLRIFLCVSGFWLFSALFAGWAALRVREAEPVVTTAVMGMAACAFLTGVLVLAFCCRYFRQQDHGGGRGKHSRVYLRGQECTDRVR